MCGTPTRTPGCGGVAAVSFCFLLMSVATRESLTLTFGFSVSLWRFQPLHLSLVEGEILLLIVRNVPEGDFPIGDGVLLVAGGREAARQADIGDEGIVGMKPPIQLEHVDRAIFPAGGDERHRISMDGQRR